MKRRRKSVRQQKKQQLKHKTDKMEIETENVSEDFCFICKDGGLLIVCDQKNCLKAYHPHCLEQDEATEETDAPWICDWHSCFVCKKPPRYQCFCCPNAVCQSCFKDALFARIRGSKGFCNNCLNIALLGEEELEVDSDGEKVDFNDRETYEGLFKEYWDIIKKKEGLTLDDLHNADRQIKKGENAKLECQKPQSDSDESVKEEENKESSSEDHESDDAVEPVIVPIVKNNININSNDNDNDNDDNNNINSNNTDNKNKMGSNNFNSNNNNITKNSFTSFNNDINNNKSNTKKNNKPKRSPLKKKGSSRIEYVGWASKALIEFLPAIGVDVSKKLTQNEVASLIITYVQENKMFHPEKRKMVVCDEHLQSLLKRKTISIYKINDALEAHFYDNLNQSDDEGYSSGDEENNDSLPSKKQAWWKNTGSLQQKGSSFMEKYQQKELKEGVLEEPKKLDTAVKVVYSDFATIAPQNMKLVYLKRNLMENLLEKDEAFASKVTGSFVKVKSEPVNLKCPYQLLPVTGIVEASGNENNGVLLQVASKPNGVPMKMLSSDDLTEEDCKLLSQKIESGLLPKPTVVELEKKAKDLHEDITKHAIARELHILKHRIDLANEKGRRAELFEYRKRRDLLQSKEEQTRLLNELPRVIADVVEVKPESPEAENNTDDAGISPSENASGLTEENKTIPA